MLFAFQADAATKVAEKAGASILESGVLGALLLISVLGNAALIWKLMKVQDKRVEDKEADNKRLERLTTTTAEVLAKVSATVSSFEQSDRTTAALLQGLKNSLDTVVLQAVLGGRRASSTGMPQVRNEGGA